MPGIDGFETTARIKARPELANVPVIFMTGLTESEHVVEAFEVGGTDYVRKPVNLMELIARVRGIWRKAAPCMPASPVWTPRVV
jgi:DNA-binding response OmpR family regulator